MSIRAKTEHHTLEIQTEIDEDWDFNGWAYIAEVNFTCTAPDDAQCRTYPPNCGCETIREDTQRPGHDEAGHVFEHGQPCWIQQWFDADLEECEYVGDDADVGMLGGVPAVSRTGHVEIVGFDTHPEWRWAEGKSDGEVNTPVKEN